MVMGAATNCYVLCHGAYPDASLLLEVTVYHSALVAQPSG
jgi:hypothetical protein